MFTIPAPSRSGFASIRARSRLLPAILLWFGFASLAGAADAVTPGITHDPGRQLVTIADQGGGLALRLRYDGRCFLDEVRVGGRNVMANRSGAWTGAKVDGQWHTTIQNIATPTVTTTKDTATIRDLHFTGGGIQFKETWQFTTKADRILWRIEREYLTGERIEDVALAAWDFADMSTWTGALLGHGGVAWCKLFDQTNATYGVHAGPVTLWKRGEPGCLRITPHSPTGGQIATRFSRQPDGVFTLAHALSEDRLVPRHGQRRYLHDRQDVWAPQTVRPGPVAIEFTLQALNYEQAYDRGQLAGVNGASIREILNTIARIGAIDDEIMGSNGYYSGFAVLHEPWIAQLGLAIDDPAYFQAYARTLNHQRDYAIGPDGRVKSRWSYTAGDAMPGTYDGHGYYECQWGWLMDSQPSYAINVAELFDFTGDLDWLRSHQASVRIALEFLLSRDSDRDGLVEMATHSHRDAKGSDWIDVIWAAHENAFVNAQLYLALKLWADAEEILGDHDRARSYRQRATQLKARFNAPTTAGGFWNDDKNCFIHWRDRDDSIHGNNIVVPVNFMAIAYDLCEPASRAQGILDQIESRMRQEGLFFWPLCLDSYQAGEGADWQFPFPVYENGDIFLAWGETGTRAYATHNPEVALKYVRNILDQYERDGLAFQRYLRKTQTGAGDDILANNCSTIVGLYRNIYGIQPKWNRLYLEPHLTPELNGTLLKYWLRDQSYEIALAVDNYQVTTDGFSLQSASPFALAVDRNTASFFHSRSPQPSLSFARASSTPLEVRIQAWTDDPATSRSWIVTGSDGSIPEQTLTRLPPNTDFHLRLDATGAILVRSDPQGRLVVPESIGHTRPVTYQLDLVAP